MCILYCFMVTGVQIAVSFSFYIILHNLPFCDIFISILTNFYLKRKNFNFYFLVKKRKAKLSKAKSFDTKMHILLCKYTYLNKAYSKNIYLINFGVPGQSRTADLSLRRRLLYPTELRKHFNSIIPLFLLVFYYFFKLVHS